MELKLFTKKRFGVGIKYNFETARLYRHRSTSVLAFNRVFTDKIKDYKFANLLYDEKEKIFALEFSNEESEYAFSLHLSSKGERRFSSSYICMASFLNTYRLHHCLEKHYKFEYKEGLWITDLNKPLEEKDNEQQWFTRLHQNNSREPKYNGTAWKRRVGKADKGSKGEGIC